MLSAMRTVLVLCLGSLCACEGTPGEARLQLYDPASGEPGWERTVPAQWFRIEDSVAEGQLRVAATDYCWTDTLLLDLDVATGQVLAEQRRGAYALTGGGADPLDPPSACATILAVQRLTLSNGERIDVCPYADDGSLPVFNVTGGGERFRLRPEGYGLTHVAGDQLLLSGQGSSTVASYSLLSGEPLWSWAGPDEYTFVVGMDPDRLYLLTETTGESHALALADGSVVWQKNLGCDSLSLAGDALVCAETLRDSTCDYD